MNDFKIVFIGDRGVGKTILCKNLLGMNFESRYVPTLGVEVHPVEHSDSVFTIWDCPGHERYGGLGDDGYYFLENLVTLTIVVFHNPQGKDMNNYNWRRDFSRVGVVPGKQYIHVMSKSDLLTKEQKEMFEKKGMLLVSGKTGEGVQEFLQTLYRNVNEKKTLRSGKGY
jgi:small GTP-binding protein